ncbi:MAG TPA: ECF transporter S component [Bacilli bacterium]|nr:ECF transporter S component [Bacilli bacterium]
MKKKDTLKIALTGILIALIVIMTFVPFLGYISIGQSISITIIHIPVIIGIILIDDWRYAITLGLAFGVSSMTRAIVAPVSVFDPIFANPAISVLPRFFIGVVGYLVLQIMKRFQSRTLRTGVVAAASTLTNTILVISALLIFQFNAIGGWAIIGPLLLLNASIEIVLAIIVSIIVDKALHQYISQTE